MPKINYKLTVQYEGTRYRGWQKQPGSDNTIQGKLESVLSQMLHEDIEVIGAGRTDAGVHALGQVANFHVSEEAVMNFADDFNTVKASWSGVPRQPYSGSQRYHSAVPETVSAPDRMADITPARKADDLLLEALNHYLPEDIAVPRLTQASARFHARYLASSKWYRYSIRTAPFSDVRNRRFLWQYGADLDTDAMSRASKALIGTHDFASFCGLKMKKSTVRTVTDIRISRPDKYTIILDFYGDGFLNHMVRLMTGELVEIGAHRSSETGISDILNARVKGAAAHTAPACGLTLMEVKY